MDFMRFTEAKSVSLPMKTVTPFIKERHFSKEKKLSVHSFACLALFSSRIHSNTHIYLDIER